MTLGERYRVQRRIDYSPLGVVYAAIDLDSQDPVNLRTLHSRHHADEAMLERFRRQLDVVQQLGDEATARVLGVLDEPGLIGYVTETLPSTLEHELGEDLRLSLERAVDLAHQIALSLAEAHAKGIIHRDIQPANVLTSPGGGQIKVLGYGLSAVQEISRDSMARGVKRSHGYIAPEQVQRQDPDARMDLYAVGSLLFRMLVGRLPYPDPDPMVVLREKVNKPAPSLGDLLPAAPKRLTALVDGLLTIDPQQRRPSTAAELARDLDAVRRQLGGDTMVPRRTSTFARVEPAPRRSALVIVAWGGAIGLFVGVAMALVQALIQPPEPPPRERAAPMAPPAAPSPDRLPTGPTEAPDPDVEVDP